LKKGRKTMNDNYLENIKTEDELFDLWKLKEPVNYLVGENSVFINHRSNIFITDGIVNLEHWNDADNKKILFILKEAYGGEKDWSLTELLKTKAPWGSIWKRVVEWTYGITNTTLNEVARYTPDNIDCSQNNTWLNRIAILNVKKSDGKPNSDMEEIKAYSVFDKKEILKQIEIINPSIIVCGGNGDIVDALFDNSIKRVKCDNWYYITELFGEKRIILDYYHPANQFPALANYYAITGIYQQALKELNGK
jgi:hypothetical protein